MDTQADNFDVDISQVGVIGNRLLDQFNQLRELDRIHWSSASNCWLITRHEDVVKGHSDELPLSNDQRLILTTLGKIPVEERMARFPNLTSYMPHWIIDVDPPTHTRLRKLLFKAFNKKVVESVRPFVRRRVESLLAQVQDGQSIEFNEQIARQIPGSVILKLLGIPQEQLPRLRGWSNAFGAAVGNPFTDDAAIKSADDAVGEMNEMLGPEIEDRKNNPKDDLLTAMVNATEDGESLSHSEMLGALHVLIVAGHDTTANTLALGTAALSQTPSFWEFMYKNPHKILECTLEIMRYIAMSATQPRFVKEDFEWHGKHLRKGDLVFLVMAAANRDDRVFKNPETMDPNRVNDKSLVFAPGLHHCIGHLLAKMQACEFFSAMVDRFESATLESELDFLPQIVFRGVSHLNVRFHQRD